MKIKILVGGKVIPARKGGRYDRSFFRRETRREIQEG
jgi:hypothetical protein